MRVIVMIKATPNSEAGILPGDPAAPPGYETLHQNMVAFNEALAEAGVLRAGDGLRPSREGKRVRFEAGERLVTDGPFAETRELLAGFWIWEVASMDEALEWVKRCPDPMPGETSVIEVRPLYEAADFATDEAADDR